MINRCFVLSSLLVLAVSAADCRSVAVDAPQPAATPSAPLYLIHPGDEIEIDFFYNPELNQKINVRPDGRISMPLIGEVQVADTSAGDLSRHLETLYKDQLKHASINVQIRTFSDQVIFVGGEVGRPGILPLRSQTTALQAILESGGLKETASRGYLFILRKSPEGKIQSVRVAMSRAQPLPPEAASFALQPLDVVIVSESRISRLDRVMDDYVKKLTPVLLTGGFTYLLGPASGIVTKP